MIEFICQRCGKKSDCAITIYPSVLPDLASKETVCPDCYSELRKEGNL